MCCSFGLKQIGRWNATGAWCQNCNQSSLNSVTSRLHPGDLLYNQWTKLGHAGTVCTKEEECVCGCMRARTKCRSHKYIYKSDCCSYWLLPAFWWPAVHTAILCQLFSFRCCTGGFPGGSSNKESTCQCRRRKRHGFNRWVGKSPWRRKWQPTPVSLPGKSHGQRSLTGYSLWGRKESDTTKRLSTSTRCCVRPDVNYSTRKILIYFIHLFIH